jgi:hypothetical protein
MILNLIYSNKYIILNTKLNYTSYSDIIFYNIKINTQYLNSIKINLLNRSDIISEINNQINLIDSYFYCWFEKSINSLLLVIKSNIYCLIILIKIFIIFILN